MNWDDTGYLLSKNLYNENSLISEIFTQNHGKISGIIFGGTSKKIKNYLQIGNQLYVNFNSKSENRIGYFKIEIFKAYSPFYFDDAKKLNCISLAMNLVKILTAESQSNNKVYQLINELYLILTESNWLKKYVFWELKLLSILGFKLDLKTMVNKKIINDKILYIAESSTEKKIVPNFLINENNDSNDINELLDGLKLVGDFMDKTILKPNNINFPKSRNQFVNSLK
ncbi:DNA repair protein RecO [Candidatus Pelagibacter sp.]|nr:DNA repair protein RecO [Candidatus Pelagibacter sp.]